MKRLQRLPIFKVLYSPLAVAILGILVLLLARSVWGVYKKETQAREARDAALYQLGVMESRRNDLARDVHDLESSEGVEAALREKFSVAKEGEEVIVIGPDGAVATSTEPEPEKKGFWGSFKGFFGE